MAKFLSIDPYLPGLSLHSLDGRCYRDHSVTGSSYPPLRLKRLKPVNYPGANAETVSDTVTKVIEQNMTGIDNLSTSHQSNW